MSCKRNLNIFFSSYFRRAAKFSSNRRLIKERVILVIAVLHLMDWFLMRHCVSHAVFGARTKHFSRTTNSQYKRIVACVRIQNDCVQWLSERKKMLGAKFFTYRTKAIWILNENGWCKRGYLDRIVLCVFNTKKKRLNCWFLQFYYWIHFVENLDNYSRINTQIWSILVHKRSWFP